MYFRMMPFSLRGGSQDTNTMEAEAAAAFTPAGGPGTRRAGRLVTEMQLRLGARAHAAQHDPRPSWARPLSAVSSSRNSADPREGSTGSPQNRHVEAPTPEARTTTLFGEAVFREMTELNCGR